MLIRTKIIATVGPASDSVETIGRMIEAGCDAFRINFSHGDNEHREQMLRNIRKAEKDLDTTVAVIADLCGPKIRTSPIAGGSVLLAEGQEIIIQREIVEGNAARISTTLGELIDAADVGEQILIDDGKIRLEVIETSPPDEIKCRVVAGGILATSKGINLPSTDLKLSAMTEKDLLDTEWITRHDFDYVALSFVRHPQDVVKLRGILDSSDCRAHIIAKIEKPQAVDRIEAIIDVADAIMVARGDLGVEMALSAVPVAQKRIARLCQQAGKTCIIATQMLESMTTAPTPTRAEVSDVANAVLDWTDAVMLSGETAVGKYPVRTVEVMNDVVASVQVYHDNYHQPTAVRSGISKTTAALAAAVREIIATDEIAAVAVFTLSGSTARVFAKSRLSCPILGMAPDEEIVRRMCLYYGVEAVRAKRVKHTRDVLTIASEAMISAGMVEAGQKIVVVSGRPLGKSGVTNTLVVHTVG